MLKLQDIMWAIQEKDVHGAHRLLPKDPSALRLSGNLACFVGAPKSQGINLA